MIYILMINHYLQQPMIPRILIPFVIFLVLIGLPFYIPRLEPVYSFALNRATGDMVELGFLCGITFLTHYYMLPNMQYPVVIMAGLDLIFILLAIRHCWAIRPSIVSTVFGVGVNFIIGFYSMTVICCIIELTFMMVAAFAVILMIMAILIIRLVYMLIHHIEGE